MLSKKICKNCWGGLWFDVDDTNWDLHSFIVCPEKVNKDRATKCDGAPPPSCPYRFEHCVAVGMKDENKDAE